ncbi:hypothetical protein OUZ56_030671 [Daphnia magna]|uniref:Uncharacterized protein n=1 Tax=Daphnia magna TaxID=35525 RepID=A0ABQ9ZS00_9CRUS|nr:hypothetical protein OUZ56_030671 [Daphnia magna]
MNLLEGNCWKWSEFVMRTWIGEAIVVTHFFDFGLKTNHFSGLIFMIGKFLAKWATRAASSVAALLVDVPPPRTQSFWNGIKREGDDVDAHSIGYGS